MDQGDINDIFHQLHILLFEPPVAHDEEDDINRDDFPGIVFIVEFEDEHGLLMHLEVRLPRYMTAFNQSIGLLRTQRALRELLLYLWITDTEYNPLVSMLTWQTDVWAVTVHAAGESSTLGFYPLYTNNPSAAHGEILMDDEQPGPSHQVNHEASPGGSRAPADQSSVSQDEIRQGAKRKRKSSGKSESREWKRSRSDHQTDSSCDSFISGESLGERSTDDEQPGLSHRDNRSQGGKWKRKTSGSSESREGKRSRSDHQFDSSHDILSFRSPPLCLREISRLDDQPGPSHQDNREARARASSAPAGQRNKSKEDPKQKK